MALLSDGTIEFSIMMGCTVPEARDYLLEGLQIGLVVACGDDVICKRDGKIEHCGRCVISDYNFKYALIHWDDNSMVRDYSKQKPRDHRKTYVQDVEFVRADGINIDTRDFPKLLEYTRRNLAFKKLVQIQNLPEEKSAIPVRGRTKGSSIYGRSDDFLTPRMHSLVQAGTPPYTAATALAVDAEGTGLQTSKAKRLVIRYENWTSRLQP